MARQELGWEFEARSRHFAYIHKGTGAQVDLFNCLPLLYEFAPTYGSVYFEKERTEEGQAWIPWCWVLLPDGTELEITESEVAEFWWKVVGPQARQENDGEARAAGSQEVLGPSLVDFLHVLDEEGTRVWDDMDHLERRAALVVLVSLIESGHINERNLPALAKAAGCFVLPLQTQDKRRPVAAAAAAAAAACDSGEEDEVVSYLTRPVAAFAEESAAHSLLKRLLKAHLGRTLQKADILLTSECMSGDQFVVTLKFGDFDGKAGSGEKFTAGPLTKKAAEEAAAAQACNWLRSLKGRSASGHSHARKDEASADSSRGQSGTEEPEHKLELLKEIEKRLGRPAQEEDLLIEVQQNDGACTAKLRLGSFAGQEAAGECFSSTASKRKSDAVDDVCSKALDFLASLDTFSTFFLQESVFKAADFIGHWRDFASEIDATVLAGGSEEEERLSVRLSQPGRGQVLMRAIFRNPLSQAWEFCGKVLDEKSSTKWSLVWSASDGQRFTWQWQRSQPPTQGVRQAVCSNAATSWSSSWNASWNWKTKSDSHGGYVLAPPTGAQSSPGWSALQEAANWKGLLQEHIQQVTRRTPTSRELCYKDKPVGQGYYKSEVWVGLAGRSFYGRGHLWRKDSQQDAARQAYEFLSGGKVGPGFSQAAGHRTLPPSTSQGTIFDPLAVVIVRPDGKEKQVLIPPQHTVARALIDYRPAALEGNEVEAEVDGAVVSNDLTFGELANTKKPVRVLIRAKADW